MLIGRFTHDSNTDTYRGGIYTLTYRTRLLIDPNPEPCPDLPFDYWVTALTPFGDLTCGRAYRRTWPSGKPYIRVDLHDPSFRRPMICHLHLASTGPAFLQWVPERAIFRDLFRRLFA